MQDIVSFGLSVFHEPGYFRAISFSAVVLNYLHTIQQMIQKQLKIVMWLISWGADCNLPPGTTLPWKQGDQMSRELVLTASARLLVGILSA